MIRSGCRRRGKGNACLGLECAGDAFEHLFIAPCPTVDEKCRGLRKERHEIGEAFCRVRLIENRLDGNLVIHIKKDHTLDGTSVLENTHAVSR